MENIRQVLEDKGIKRSDEISGQLLYVLYKYHFSNDISIEINGTINLLHPGGDSYLDSRAGAIKSQMGKNTSLSEMIDIVDRSAYSDIVKMLGNIDGARSDGKLQFIEESNESEDIG